MTWFVDQVFASMGGELSGRGRVGSYPVFRQGHFSSVLLGVDS